MGRTIGPYRTVQTFGVTNCCLLMQNMDILAEIRNNQQETKNHVEMSYHNQSSHTYLTHSLGGLLLLCLQEQKLQPAR